MIPLSERQGAFVKRFQLKQEPPAVFILMIKKWHP